MEQGGKGSRERRLSTARKNLGLSHSAGAVKSGTPLTLKPSGLGRFIYFLLTFCGTFTDICEQKGLKHPQGSQPLHAVTPILLHRAQQAGRTQQKPQIPRIRGDTLNSGLCCGTAWLPSKHSQTSAPPVTHPGQNP